jgi:hypothetical protein
MKVKAKHVKYIVSSTVPYTASCSGQLYFLFLSCLSIYSSTILHCNRVNSSKFCTSSHISIYCSILFSLHFSLLHNLSWYQSIRCKPLHTIRRATRSSQCRASRILREHDIAFSQGLESCRQYSQKIVVRSLRRKQSVQRSKDPR